MLTLCSLEDDDDLGCTASKLSADDVILQAVDGMYREEVVPDPERAGHGRFEDGLEPESVGVVYLSPPPAGG